MNDIAKYIVLALVGAMLASALALNAWKSDLTGFQAVSTLIAQKEMRVIKNKVKTVEAKGVLTDQDRADIDDLQTQLDVAEVIYDEFLLEK